MKILTGRTKLAAITALAIIACNALAQVGGGSGISAPPPSSTPTFDTLNVTGLSDFSMKATFNGTTVFSSTAPATRWEETDATVDNGKWKLRVVSEQFVGQVTNDANNSDTTWLTVDRTGTTVDTINFAATNVQVNGTNIPAVPLTAVKTADTARSSTTVLVADPHLSIVLAAQSNYRFDAWLRITFANATPDIKFRTLPSVAVDIAEGSFISAPSTNLASGDDAGDSWFATTIIYNPTDAADRELHLRGYIDTGATAPTVTIEWAQNTSDAGAVTLLQGSWMQFTAIG